MKKATLFATILALALAASAQEAHFPGPNVIAPSARGGHQANAVGVTTLPGPNARSARATAKTGPIAAVGSNAIQVGSTAPKNKGICTPIMVIGLSAGLSPPCK